MPIFSPTNLLSLILKCIIHNSQQKKINQFILIFMPSCFVPMFSPINPSSLIQLMIHKPCQLVVLDYEFFRSSFPRFNTYSAWLCPKPKSRKLGQWCESWSCSFGCWDKLAHSRVYNLMWIKLLCKKITTSVFVPFMCSH